MSTLSNTDLTVADANITTLKDASGNNPSTPAEINSGRAKFWINFTGTGTISTNASYNVTGIADNGTGDYTITIATDFSSANWCFTAQSWRSGTADSNDLDTNIGMDDIAAGTVRVQCGNGGGTSFDHAKVFVAGFGDQ
jgi:hypothetical protein